MVRKRYIIDYAEDIEDDLAELRAYDQARILDRIDEQLIYEPARETRNKKMPAGIGSAMGLHRTCVGITR